MMNYFSFQIHGGASHGGLISLLSEFLEFVEDLSSKTPPEMFATLFPGIASMDNIHPLFVHFPIAFFIGFFLMDVAGSWKLKQQWRYAASCMLYLGTIAAIFTVLAGFSAAETVEHDADVHEIMERHEHIGVTVLISALFLTIWRVQRWSKQSGFWNRVFLGLSAALCVLIAFGADLGGLMVYGHGVATRSSIKSDIKPHDISSEEKDHNNHGHDHSGHDHSH